MLSSALSPSAFAVTIATWDNDSAPNNKWDRKQNWSGNKKPSQTDDVAIFTGAGNPGIEFTKDATVGELRYDSSLGYNITGSKSLTFDVTSGSATLSVLSTNTASHELGVEVILADDLVIDHEGGGLMTLSGVISGAGRNVTVRGSGSTVMSASNSYDGTTTVTGGTLSLGADNVFADSSSVVVDGGTFDIGTRSDTINAVTLQSGNLSGTGSLAVSSLTLGPGISDIGVDVTFATPATDLILDNASSDIVTVSRSVRHSGRTKVKQGRLKLKGQGALAESSTIEISSGAILDVAETDSGGLTLESGQVLSGTGTVVGSMTVASGSQLSPGNSPGTLTTGDQLWEGGGSLLLEMDDAEGGAGVGWDLVDIIGILTITADVLNPFEIDLASLLVGTDTPGDASNLNFPGPLPAPGGRCI